MASRILAVRYNFCPHISAKKTVAAFHGTLKDVFEQNHPPLDCKNFSQKAENEAFGELSLDITVQDLDAFKINKLSFHCQARPAKSTEGAECDVDNIAPPLPNAFAILMGVTSEFVPKKTNSSGAKTGITRKDELYNDLATEFEKRGLKWPRAGISEGSYLIQVLCNALWYVTNQHQVINDAAQRKSKVQPIPSSFDKYVGKYSILDKVMSLAAIHAPIFFDEEKHLDKPFESPLQKFRFFRNMILSVPVDIVKYCPGGIRSNNSGPHKG
ncbi:hypothetical protein LSAT2_014110 [Lamellibrachia satsuma]|nr:hypothetical protein LSAT2_014110 [Lamellibrachia satsuma]